MHLVYRSPKFCITVVSNSPGYYSHPKRNVRQWLYNFSFCWGGGGWGDGGGDKVLYGLCENGEFFMHIYLSVSFLQE